jgi:UDP:flavonoid glycosyltransferase YjiC (YdhE family)
MVMAETDFPHSTAKNIKYIGPMVYESREEQKETPEDKRLSEILLRKKDKEKLVYCSVGSMAKGYLPFLKNVLSAVSNLDGVLLILSIGPKMSKASFQDIPTNVFIFNWISQLKVLSKADCAIIPGGINTINECIHYKVPMLLYSTRYTDQNGNVARMAYHGLGIRGDVFNEGVEQIRANILKILEEKEIQARVLKMNAVYREYRKRELTSFLN